MYGAKKPSVEKGFSNATLDMCILCALRILHHTEKNTLFSNPYCSLKLGDTCSVSARGTFQSLTHKRHSASGRV